MDEALVDSKEQSDYVENPFVQHEEICMYIYKKAEETYIQRKHI